MEARATGDGRLGRVELRAQLGGHAVVVGVEVVEFDLAEVFCFKPMNHGRHGAAGPSGEAEEFHELQCARIKFDHGWIGGFEIRSA